MLMSTRWSRELARGQVGAGHGRGAWDRGRDRRGRGGRGRRRRAARPRSRRRRDRRPSRRRRALLRVRRALARGGRTGRGRGRARARRPRRPRQQRGHQRVLRRGRDDRGGLGHRVRRGPQGRLDAREGDVAGVDRAARLDRQHQLDPGAAHDRGLLPLRGGEGGPRGSHPLARPRVRAPGRSCQRGRARVHGHPPPARVARPAARSAGGARQRPREDPDAAGRRPHARSGTWSPSC